MSTKSQPTASSGAYSSVRPFANPRSNVGTRSELLEQVAQMGLPGDQETPIKIEFDDICAASFRIRGSVAKTPCEVWKIMFPFTKSNQLNLVY